MFKHHFANTQTICTVKIQTIFMQLLPSSEHLCTLFGCRPCKRSAPRIYSKKPWQSLSSQTHKQPTLWISITTFGNDLTNLLINLWTHELISWTFRTIFKTHEQSLRCLNSCKTSSWPILTIWFYYLSWGCLTIRESYGPSCTW